MARRMLKIVATIATALMTTAVLGIAVIVFILPRLTHGEALTVLTGSMQPTIPPGSIVFVRPVDPHNVRVGDVITFAVKSSHYGTSLVTHRVVAEKLALDSAGEYQPEFITKGDANNAPDLNPVQAQNVRGVMWFHLPHVGGIRDAMHTKGGVAGIAVVVLTIYAGLQVVAATRERRSEGSANAQQRGLPTWVVDELTNGRSVTVARFTASGFDGASARAVATLLGAGVITEAEGSFTVLLVSPAERSDADVTMLESLEPEALWTGLRRSTDTAMDSSPASALPAATYA